MGIILFILGLGATLFFVGKSYAGTILNEVIKRETNGFYQIKFESLDFDAFESRIKVNNLHLQADSTHDFSKLGLNNIYEIHLAELVIDLESIYELYLDKELIIKSVRVVDPDIDMVSLETDKRTKFSFEAGNMYKAISDYLKVLKIDYFRIQDGDLQYDGDQFALGEIDFLVKNLLMDSTARKNQVFYSEQIQLEIRNQHFHLPDSIHQITFDKFILSTADSILTFENLRVQPLASSGVTFEGQNDVNVYDIHVPKLSFKGVDYVSAYQDNHLIIEELILDEPIVFVDDESHTIKQKDKTDNSLLTLIFNIFGSLDVGKLRVNNAHVDIKIDKVDTYQRLKVEESSVVFHNIHLDTSNYRFDHRFKYFEDIELDIHNYSYLLPDSTHTVFFELLRVNSFDSELSFKNMQISHEREGNETKILVDAEVPNFKLKNIDFQRAIADKVLIAGTMELSNALLVVRNTGSTTKQQKVTVNNLYQSIAPFFREISIDQIRFSDVELTLPKGINVNRIDLDMRYIHVSAASRSFQRLFNDSKLIARNFSFDRDSIKVIGENLLIDDRMSAFQLIDWEVDIETNNQHVHGRFDSLMISEISIDSLIDGNYTAFRRAFLVNPDFEFDVHMVKGGEKGGLGIEKELIVSGGRLSGNVDSLELSMDGLDADIFVGDSTAFRSMGIENISLRSAAYNHQVELAKWSYDTSNSEMLFYDLLVKPINSHDTSRMLLNADVPFVRLTAFEQSKFFDENHLFTDLVHLIGPNIRLQLAKMGKKAGSDSLQSRNPFTMVMKRLKIDSSNVMIVPQGEANLDSLRLDVLNVELFDLSFPRDKPFTDGAIYSDSMIFIANRISPYLPSGDSLSLNRTSYHSATKNLTIDSFYYADHKQFSHLLVPSIQFKNLDLEGLYESKKFKVDSLLVRNPSGDLQIGNSGKNNPFTSPIEVGYTSITGINFNFSDTTNQRNYLVQNGDLLIESFQSEDTLTADQIMDRLDRLSFKAGPYFMPIGENYNLSLERYQFDYPANTLGMDDIHLIPKYSALEYSENLERQNDWFDVSVGSIYVDEIDLKAILSEKRYEVGKVNVDDLSALIYRDKGVPFPENQIRHLPQHYIRELETAFHIDTISLKGAIKYREKPDNYFTYGEISFDSLDVTLRNVGNVDMTSADMMLLHANGKLMESGRFEVNGAFNLKDENEPFSLNGTVKDFQLDSMNRMLGPVANVNIKSGYARDLYFNFRANDTLSRGEMRFRYDDLKIQILNTKTHDTQGFGQGIKTFFANTFVVKNKNPSYLVFLRKGTIFQRRDSSRAIFNYWGKSLLSGAVSSIGVHKSDKAEKKFERNFIE
ncbi:hypothetical protein [Ekhidna lutea]|nr:hypothetical protein [Ekhidna lutea]